MKSLIENFSLKSEYLLIAYAQLGHLLNEFEIGVLPDLTGVVLEKLMDLLRKAVESLENQEKTIRVEFDYNQLDGQKYQVTKIPKCDFNFNLIDLLNMVFYLNKNEKFRLENFTKYKISEEMKKVKL